MAGLSAESSSCLALVVQSPLAAAHAKANVRVDHPCLLSMHACDAEYQLIVHHGAGCPSSHYGS